MKILGDRILVSKIEEPVKDGFTEVIVQDEFVFKGKVEQIGNLAPAIVKPFINTGDIVMFRKYSPNTEDIEHEGKKMKIVCLEDVIAIL